jgi:hypothetical protein
LTLREIFQQALAGAFGQFPRGPAQGEAIAAVIIGSISGHQRRIHGDSLVP